MAAEYDRTVLAVSSETGVRDPPWDVVTDQDIVTDPNTIFELIHPLGRGSYGSVYKARMIDTGDIVAVKIIPLTEADEIGNVQKEISMLRDCDHPNIVRYYGSWRAPDALWIAMEYCAGGSITDIMHACNAPLEEDVISYVCNETLAGLTYLHAMGRVHRDIKCGNILLTESGEVKLADFGVAAQLTSTLSKRNTFIGTPHWMAPEVIQASHYDGKVDVWALGISLIEMAEIYPPRWRVNPNRVIFMVVREPPPRLEDKDRWTLAFQDFIAQCLTKDPRSRPTARFLQQHKFLNRERGSAVRMLMPLIHRAKDEYAAMGIDRGANADTESEENAGYFSWRAVDKDQGLSGTVLIARTATLPTEFSAEGDSGLAVGATVLVHSPDGGNLSDQVAAVSTEMKPQRLDHLELGAEGAEVADYQAAVRRVESLQAPSIQTVNDVPFGTTRLIPGGAKRNVTPQGGQQKMVERLFNIYSSGDVVPLPYIHAADVNPLGLLTGILQEGYSNRRSHHDWRFVILSVLRELQAGQSGSQSINRGINDDALEQLVYRIESSISLSNLTLTLARYKDSLATMQDVGAPGRELEWTKERINELTDTLRAILCL
jgi:serine/threonine protein kinase